MSHSETNTSRLDGHSGYLVPLKYHYKVGGTKGTFLTSTLFGAFVLEFWMKHSHKKCHYWSEVNLWANDNAFQMQSRAMKNLNFNFICSLPIYIVRFSHFYSSRWKHLNSWIVLGYLHQEFHSIPLRMQTSWSLLLHRRFRFHWGQRS